MISATYHLLPLLWSCIQISFNMWWSSWQCSIVNAHKTPMSHKIWVHLFSSTSHIDFSYKNSLGMGIALHKTWARATVGRGLVEVRGRYVVVGRLGIVRVLRSCIIHLLPCAFIFYHCGWWCRWLFLSMQPPKKPCPPVCLSLALSLTGFMNEFTVFVMGLHMTFESRQQLIFNKISRWWKQYRHEATKNFPLSRAHQLALRNYWD